jgi:transposase
VRGGGAVEAAAPSGDRVKTDAKDALYLARLLRLGEITPVAVPCLAQEIDQAGDVSRVFVAKRGAVTRRDGVMREL